MKKLLYLFLILVSAHKLQAQVTLYQFSQSSGTYTEISGDTTVASASWDSGPGALSNVIYSSNSLPFSFSFNGTAYTNVVISSNGFITFGTTLPQSNETFPISSGGAYNGAVSALGQTLMGTFITVATCTGGSNVLSNVQSFWGVLTGRVITGSFIPASTITGFNIAGNTITVSNNASQFANQFPYNIASGSIVRGTTGSIGSRVHTIQWKNFRVWAIPGYHDNCNFQIKLYETSNKLEIVYGNFVKSSGSVNIQVGLRGATNTDFNNRTGSNWSTSTAGENNSATLSIPPLPGSGTVYTFTPPQPGPALIAPSNNAVNQSLSPAFSWTSVSGSTSYQLQISTDINFSSLILNDSSIVNTNYSLPSGLLQNGNTYYWRVRGRNIIVNSFYSSTNNFSTSGATGAGLDFDGVNDYVYFPNIPGINNFSSTLKFSIEFWCRVNSDTGNFTFVNKGGGAGNEQYSIDIFSTNLRYYVKSGGGVFTHIQVPRLTVAEGWVHLAATFDYSLGIMKLYKNGNQVGTASPPSSLNSNTNPFAIGVQVFPLNQYLRGEVDELRIWNHARSQTEIQNNRYCEIPTASTGLLANYHFNQGTAAGINTDVSSLTDASGNNNHGALNGFALTGSTSNWIAPTGVITGSSCGAGEALDFDGVNDNVNIPNAAGVNNFSTGLKFSIEFKCKVNSDAGNFTFVNKGGGGGLEQYSIDIFGTNLRYYVRSAGGIFTFINIPRLTVAEGWVQIAATFDYAAGIMKLYKNGIEVGTATPPSSLNSNTNPLAFGVQANSTNQPLNGKMDEVRIWNYARGQAAIQNNMNCEIATSAPGLVANYHFNEGAAAGINTGVTSLIDVSASNNNGTLVNFALTGPTSNWIAPGGVVTGNSCILFSTINIKAIPQGFYNSNDQLNRRDTLRAYLHSNVSPYDVLDSSKSVVDSVTFTGAFGFNTGSGTYYIVMKHRNSIETWSKSGGENFVQGSTMNYDFTNAITNAFGSNEIQVDTSPLRFGVYSGEVIQDGIIDVADMVNIYNDVNLVLSGYVVTDVTGDDFVDVSDLILTYNNVTNVISVIRP